MTDKKIREKIHTDGILDKALSIVRDKAGGYYLGEPWRRGGLPKY